MSATSSRPMVPEPARTRVQLDELVALRLRIGRARRLAWPVVANVAAGDRAGRRRGRGMDYLESRVYAAGDDVRHVDWRLTARRGQLHTKVFQEEYEPRLMLIVDGHASMHFGTHACFKSVHAARVAALLAWQTVRAGGRVGALAFGPCRQGLRAASGERGALAVCGALVRWDAVASGGAEALSAALQRMRPLLRGASRVVLITDGRSGDAGTQAALATWHRRARMSVVLVADAIEHELPPRGRFALDCAGQRVTVNLLDRRAREQFRATLAAPAQRLQAACAALHIPCVPLDTRADPLDAVDVVARAPGRR